MVLTGGGIGTAVLRALAGADGVDWTAVDVWWGDERWVPADDDDRNEKGARAALLDVVGVPAERVHAIPASDAGYAEPEDAAAAYAAELLRVGGGELPRIDVAAARRRAGGARGVDLPGLPRGARRPAGGRRPRLPEATAHPGQPRPAGHHRRRGGLAAGRPARARPRPWPAGCPAGRPRVSLPAAGAVGRRATRWMLDPDAASQLG